MIAKHYHPSDPAIQKLSVIIPLFNEAKIKKNLKLIETEIARRFADFEIICVDDGSRDSTLKKLNGFHSSRIKIVSYPMNIGKGFALCFGFTKSKGNLIAFYDGDLDIHPKHIALYIDLMDVVGADIVIGSKRHPLSKVKYSATRRIYSRLYQSITRLMFGLNITDTQVGIKVFRRRVLEKVIPKLIVKNWAFDLELLVVAKHLGYRKIIEAPVELKQRRFGSKIDVGAVASIVIDTVAIFYRRYLARSYRPGYDSNHSRLTAKLQKALSSARRKL